MSKATILAGLTCLALWVSLSCGGGGSQEEIALGIAEKWTDDSIENVSDSIVQTVAGELPIASRLAGNILKDQIKERASWSFRGIGTEEDDTYRVVATASVDFSISLPIVGDREYSMSLPFDLWIDTEDGLVERWVPKISSVSIEEQES